jgi:DNA replication protein DnaC
VAGNPEHAEALLKAHPDAKSAECAGGRYSVATLTGADGYVCQVRCPACERERMIDAVAAFIPPRFRAAIKLPPKITDWAKRGREAQGLYLAGPVGTGKTHAAWSALGEWCVAAGVEPFTPRTQGVEGWSGAGPTVIFTRMTDLLDDLRPGDSARLRVRDCQTARLLVLDDVGAEKASEWTQERIYSVIDHRYANCLPLIVTSNLPPGKLAEQTGDRSASRLAEMCEVVAMTGTDRRRNS